MTKKLLLTASALGAMFGTFALTGEAHAAAFMCGALQCEENPGGLYPNGAVCWATSGQKNVVYFPTLQTCVEANTKRTAVTFHVVAQGASGRVETTWNGGRAVTAYALGADSLFPESYGYLYYQVGKKPGGLVTGQWLLERPENGSYVTTTEIPTLDNVIVLAGGGGSRGRVEDNTRNGDGEWTRTDAIGGRGGWALGQSSAATLCTTGSQPDVCAAGAAGGGDAGAGGGGGGGDLQGGTAGAYGGSGNNLPSEGGWGQLFGPAANGAYNGVFDYQLMGGEGGQGDGGGGGGGVSDSCGVIECNRDRVNVAAGGGGGSRARVTSIQQTIPVFEETARVEFVFSF